MKWMRVNWAAEAAARPKWRAGAPRCDQGGHLRVTRDACQGLAGASGGASKIARPSPGGALSA
eukprot:8456889-Pyramimonas_sp.AAC.1